MIINGVCLNPSDNGDYMVGTDGRRMGAFNTIKFPFKETCVVPASKFLTWSKLVSEELLIDRGFPPV